MSTVTNKRHLESVLPTCKKHKGVTKNLPHYLYRTLHLESFDKFLWLC